MATAIRDGVLLRMNFGSHSEVRRVFAFDPDRDTALCLVWDQWGGENLHHLGADELEALQQVGSEHLFRGVRDELAKRAEYTIRR